MKTLLIGAGRKKEKIISKPLKGWGGENPPIELHHEPITGDLVTLDINADHAPDVVHDLNVRPLPFKDDEFDEIHAYEVLEHIGRQGDYVAFFEEFSEYWRILKPGGRLIGTCPHHKSVWAWGDPSHTRVLPLECFVFLSQAEYKSQVGRTPMSDFRHIYKADFKMVAGCNIGEQSIYFVLEAVKPSGLEV